MAGKKGQKKRFWSDEEKVSICAQASAPGISIAQVARRYSMNTNLIHKWLKDPRFAPNEDDCERDTAHFFANRGGWRGVSPGFLSIIGITFGTSYPVISPTHRYHPI